MTYLENKRAIILFVEVRIFNLFITYPMNMYISDVDHEQTKNIFQSDNHKLITWHQRECIPHNIEK